MLKLTKILFECVDDLGYEFQYSVNNENLGILINSVDSKGFNPYFYITKNIFVPARIIKLYYNEYGSQEKEISFKEFIKLGRPLELL